MTQLSLVALEGERKELGRLMAGEVVVGREPAEGIAVPSQAVSRSHARFVSFKSHWLFQDLGSTNGSWINGAQLKANQWRIVRPGDLVQLADFAFEVVPYARSNSETMSGFPSLGARSVLVSAQGIFNAEFKISEYGRALAIGGTGADLELDGDLAELPSLVVERRGDKTVVFGLAHDCPKYLNGEEIKDNAAVVDGDEIAVGQYLLIVNDPSTKISLHGNVASQATAAAPAAASSGTQTEGPAWERPQAGEKLTESGYLHKHPADAEPRSTIRLPFGRNIEDIPDTAETVAIDVARGLANEAGTRRGGSELFGPSFPQGEGESNWASLEDRIVLVVGLTLLVMLMLLVVWWIFL